MRICILRLSAIGDCINAASAVFAVQKQNPKAKITWIIGPAAYALLKDLMPEVEFVVYRKDGIRGFKELRHLMKGRTFDYLLLMQYAMSASLASIMISARERVGFDSERAREFQSLFVNRHIAPGGGRHVVDGFMGFVSAMDFRPSAPKWEFFFSPDLMERSSELLGKASNYRRICIISPCTSKRYKDWPIESCIKTAAYLVSKNMCPVLIGGSSPEELKFEQSLMNAVPQTMTLIGRTTLPQCMACIRLADFVISADTAAVHMANAMGTPVIGLYATHDPQRVGPYNDRRYCVSVYEDLVRREYGRDPAELPWRTRVRDPKAMFNITLDMIIGRIEMLVHDLDEKDNAQTEETSEFSDSDLERGSDGER
jgi:heptosyltransferase I